MQAQPDSDINNDRELIRDFLPQTQEVESYLIVVQTKNRTMKKLAEQEVLYEKKGELDQLVNENNHTFKKI